MPTDKYFMKPEFVTWILAQAENHLRFNSFEEALEAYELSLKIEDIMYTNSTKRAQ